MRIAIANWSNRKVGGVEIYLNTVIPELARAGHEIAFCCEVDGPPDRQRIELCGASPKWCVADMGEQSALTALRHWHPDVIYCHKLTDPLLESKIIGLAPSVFFAHDYNGTCISGEKTFKFPIVQPCSRRFGWQCLIHYFPHRCGGLSPITMVKLYSLQSKRLENLKAYDAVVTHSNHMLAELTNHGLSPQHTYKLPFYLQSSNGSSEPIGRVRESTEPFGLETENGGGRIRPVQSGVDTELNLLFSGRMEYLKGAHVFIDALSEVSSIVRKPLRATFAGDGRERRALEHRAAQVRRPGLKINFCGWLEPRQLESILKSCHLLVVPSLWPEPFGLVGLEAGRFGVPAAAFDVGGIRDWLVDGANGHLASGKPPTSKGLAEAIIKCLTEPATYLRLRRGAVELSSQYNIQNHMKALLKVFSSVVKR